VGVKNRADFVLRNFTGFKWILGYSTSLLEGLIDILASLIEKLWQK